MGLSTSSVLVKSGGPTHPRRQKFFARPKIPFSGDLTVSTFHPDSCSAGKVFTGRLAFKRQAMPSSPPCPPDLYWPRWGVRPIPGAKNFSPSHIFRFPDDLRVSVFHPYSRSAGGESCHGAHRTPIPHRARPPVQQICTGQVGGPTHPHHPGAQNFFRRAIFSRLPAI